MMDQIKVVNIHKYFRSGILHPKYNRVLNGVSFSLSKGKNMAIIGPNGSGKTTLLKVLATLFTPDKGKANILGYDLLKDAKKIREISSFVSPALDFQKKLTLRETVKFYARVQGVNPENAYKFLNEMQITHMLDERLEAFSEGEKTMARFAISLVKQPELFLVDEVAANLDLKRKEMLLEFLIESLRDATLLIVDHDPEIVDRLCSSILLLQKGGKVLTMGSVEEMMGELPYQWDVSVYPKQPMSNEFWNRFGFQWQRFGGVIRFFLQEKREVCELASQLVEEEKFLSFEASGISMEDVYYWWMDKLGVS